MASKRNHLLHHFLITTYAQITFNKNQQEEMLIEQNIEFKLRGPGPSGRTCTPITG